MSVPIQLPPTRASLAVGRPVRLFVTPTVGQYAISTDGQRFLLHSTLQDSQPAAIVMMLNWNPNR
jgi:hypothetical protein